MNGRLAERHRELERQERIKEINVNGNRKLTHFSGNRKSKIDPPPCQLSICTAGTC